MNRLKRLYLALFCTHPAGWFTDMHYKISGRDILASEVHVCPCCGKTQPGESNKKAHGINVLWIDDWQEERV